MSSRFIVCVNTRVSGKPACGDSGSAELAERLEREIARRGLTAEVERAGCLGRCAQGPNMRIAPAGAFFHHVSANDIGAMVDALEQRLAEAASDAG